MDKVYLAHLVTTAGDRFQVRWEEDKTFTPSSLTDAAVHRFILKNRQSLMIQGDKIVSIRVTDLLLSN